MTPTHDADLFTRWFMDSGPRFLDDHYVARKPLVVHGPLERFGLKPEMFDDLDRFIRGAPNHPPLTVYVPGAAQGPIQILSDPESAAACFKLGHTVSIESAVVREVAAISLALGRALGVRAHPATLVSATGEAVPSHFDSIDAFVLVVRGVKRWTIAPNQITDPNFPYFPNLKGGGARGGRRTDRGLKPPAYFDEYMPLEMPSTGNTTFDLVPGSVAFVPAGWWHRTTSIEPCLSYTVRIPGRDFGSVLGGAIAKLLQRNSAWRGRVPLVGHPAHRDRAAGAIGERLGALLEEVAQLTTGDILRAELGPFYRRVTGVVLPDEPPGRRHLQPVLRWIADQTDGFHENELRAYFWELSNDDALEAIDVALAAGVVTEE